MPDLPKAPSLVRLVGIVGAWAIRFGLVFAFRFFISSP
jgi:hypothetical protein